MAEEEDGGSEYSSGTKSNIVLNILSFIKRAFRLIKVDHKEIGNVLLYLVCQQSPLYRVYRPCKLKFLN